MIKEIPLNLPNFHNQKRIERGIMTSSVTSLIRLAYEGQKALHKAFEAMENNVNLARTNNFHMENPVITYGIYNVETVEKQLTQFRTCIAK